MFSILFDSQPRRFLRKTEKQIARRILNKIELLKTDPIPHDAKRVAGHREKIFRVRVGNYRILYRINYEANRVVVVKLDKRDRVFMH